MGLGEGLNLEEAYSLHLLGSKAPRSVFSTHREFPGIRHWASGVFLEVRCPKIGPLYPLHLLPFFCDSRGPRPAV